MLTTPQKLIASNLELDPGWIVQTGPLINDPPPTSFNIEQTTDALELYISGPKNSGALATLKLPIDLTRPYVGLDLEVYLDEIAVRLIRCLEMDVKGAHSGRIFNWSTQNNQGQMQMDPASRKWTNIGFSQPLVVGWNKYSFRYWADFKNFIYAYLSVNGFNPSTDYQGLTCPSDTWADVMAIQLQLCINQVPGAFRARYRNITFTQCAQAF